MFYPRPFNDWEECGGCRRSHETTDSIYTIHSLSIRTCCFHILSSDLVNGCGVRGSRTYSVKPLLTVVTGTRNRHDELTRLIDSVIRLTRVPYELIIGDASDSP